MSGNFCECCSWRLRSGRGQSGSRGGPEWTGRLPTAPFINTHTHTHLQVSVNAHRCIPPVSASSQRRRGQTEAWWLNSSLWLLSSHPDTHPRQKSSHQGEKKNLVDCFAATLFLLSSSKPNCNHFTSARHVQLQLLPCQVGPGVEGEAAQIKGEELRLLHEDLFILFIPHPVAHHRQPGALPHLWTAGEDCRGAKDQGQWPSIFKKACSRQQFCSTSNDL